MNICALGADLSTSGDVADGSLERKVARTLQTLELARDLAVPQVTARVGLPAVKQHALRDLFREALACVAEQADRVGCHFLIETAGNSAQTLSEVLGELNCDHLKLCYDPGELMMAGLDPLAPIELLADDIMLSHIRDATIGTAQRPGQETVLGRGQLNLPAYLAQLEQAGYRGPHLIRRAHSDRPADDIAACRDHASQFIG